MPRKLKKFWPVQRDYPEIAARLRAGEFASAREAARAAGIDVVERTVYVSADPSKAAQALIRHFGDDFCAALARALLAEAEGRSVPLFGRPAGEVGEVAHQVGEGWKTI